LGTNLLREAASSATIGGVDASPGRVPDAYPVRLIGERITLREVEPDDAPDALAWSSDPTFFRYLAYEPIAALEDEARFLAGLARQAGERPRVQYHLGIEWLEDRRIVGIARLGVSSPTHRGGDIGYGVRRDMWAQGIASEAAGLLLDFGFGTLGLHRISATRHPENVASGRVLDKLGMRYEGRHRDDMFEHGQWRDSLIYAIVEDDWRERRSKSTASVRAPAT
jgi:ribosomal-protein-alanine N-acetyltransferase